MLISTANRWRIRQWVTRERRRLAAAAVFALVCTLLAAVGAFDSLTASWQSAMFGVRGSRVTTQRVVSVLLDDNYAELAGGPPFAQESFTELIDRIAADSADVVAVYLPPTLVTPAAAATSYACGTRVIFYGPQRPSWLARECRWHGVSENPLAPSRGALWRTDGRRSLEGRVVEIANISVEKSEFLTNYSGGLPSVSAGNLVEDAFPEGLFSGRVVFVSPTVGGLAGWTETPFGPVPGEVTRAEKVATAVDNAGVFYSRLLEQILFLVGMAIGGWVFGRRRNMAWLSGVSSAWLVVELVAFSFELTLGGPMMLMGIWATVFVGLTVPIDRKEAGLEVQVRLVEAVKEAQERRAAQLSNNPNFWPMLLERADAIVNVKSMAIAELPPESWWISYKAFQNMTEDDIKERRRDVRRRPYKEGFHRHQITTSAGYVGDDTLGTIFVPLVAREKVVGFWSLNQKDPDAYVARNRTVLERIGKQLAQEVHWFHLEAGAPELMAGGEADVLDSALAAMEHLELDRRLFRDIIESANVGLMLTNLFGEVTFQNEVMTEFFASLETDGQESVFELFGMLVGKTSDRVQHEFNTVLETQTPITYAATTQGEPKKRLEFRISAVTRKGQGSDVVRTLSITAIDMSSTLERESARLEVVEQRSARAQDLVRVLSSYTSVLDETQQRVDVTRGIEASVNELAVLVADVDIALGMDVSDVTQLPLNVQLTIREALRGAAAQTDLPGVSLSLPERTILARGEPEIVQRAIRLLILDATELAPGDTEIRIDVEEDGDSLIIHVRVPDVAVPNSLLQQMLEGEEQSDDNRLFLARNHVETGGGVLMAESSLSDGLHFAIKLIRDG